MGPLRRLQLRRAFCLLVLAACANSRPGASSDASLSQQAVLGVGDGAVSAAVGSGGFATEAGGLPPSDGLWPVATGSRFLGVAMVNGAWRIGLASSAARSTLTLVSVASGSTQVVEYAGQPDKLTTFGEEPFVLLDHSDGHTIARSLADDHGVSLDPLPEGELDAREEDGRWLALAPPRRAFTRIEDTRVPLSPAEEQAASRSVAQDGASGGCLAARPVRVTETRFLAGIDKGGAKSSVVLSRVDPRRWDIEGDSLAVAPEGVAVTYFETRVASQPGARLIGAWLDWHGRLSKRVVVDRPPIEPSQGSPLLLADGIAYLPGSRSPSSDSEDVVVVVLDRSGPPKTVPLAVRGPVHASSDLATLRCGGSIWIVASEQTEPDFERLLAFRMGPSSNPSPPRQIFSHRYGDPRAAAFSRDHRTVVVACAHDHAAAAYSLQEGPQGPTSVAFAEWDARMTEP